MFPQFKHCSLNSSNLKLRFTILYGSQKLFFKNIFSFRHYLDIKQRAGFYRFNELGLVDLFEDQEEGLKYRIMFSISVPLAFRTQGFATRAFLGTTTGALSPKQNVSYEHTVSPIAQRNVIPLGFYCIHKKYHLRYYFFSPGVFFFLDSKNL